MKKSFQNSIYLFCTSTLICSACSTSTKLSHSETFSDGNLAKKRGVASQTPAMKYSKITGTLLKFEASQRLNTGLAYSSQETRAEDHKIIMITFENHKKIETVMKLEGTNFLDFTTHSDDPRIPMISGHFFNSDYEDCVLTATLPDQKLKVIGVVTKLDKTHGLSTKTLSNLSTGQTVGIMQERIELISVEEFEKATRLEN